MKLRHAIPLGLLVASVVALNGWWWWSITCHCSGGDLASGAQALSSPSSLKQSSHVAVDRSVPAANSAAEVAARLSEASRAGDSMTRMTRETEYLGERSALDASVLSDYELDPGAEPTWEGLYAMTVEAWSQEEFLDHAGIGDMYGLPTEDECRAALRDSIVSRLLTDVCSIDLKLVSLGAIPDARRSAYTDSMVAWLVHDREVSMSAMTARLDRISGYKSWNLMWRLHESWAR